ncbi:Ig-like domain-containing protein [Ethanoligenens harbinense]|uniref:Uncharacterized protein n=1 Tax=Ethanoligenens harbinense (strain DSM 18485 / JCM 12961 / CGMCC 1.5033 / YUAN-3) TaxID=663278 RepID=E6U5T7_ETHHY|nr:Ig-like domain-containing protein [Ethanoligenens harbinense]ADU27954.1 hypothetical protein Ethha_2460 [Ethanoligenens harbinense YUAN-3]AVQ96983.1 hypothetical protein CXQ68_12635 [Ethanoligenens harbinense YUAN-3]AYF39643.1 hypothetical protein CXP51_12530 [Ethanoligenens harbinense]AYF42471.1 hypothetical protein CN246_13085 [Ethanoligenens harbinense]QCN93224.1 hypothetical protein DRA42_12680 [Ethanoligenens harbinense]
MNKQATTKAKKVKELRSKMLVIAMAAILTVAGGAVSASAAPVTTSVQTAASVRYKAATGGITDLDTPATTYTGTIPVYGWVLNASGINRVDVYALDSTGHYHGIGSVDGSKLTARQDVQNVFPAYGTLNSGYSLTANVSTLAPGSYTLCVAGIGKDGSVNWSSVPVSVGPEPLTDIDAPSGGSEQDGSITISGWALNHGGINRVDVYALDSSSHYHGLGSVAGDTLTARQDVENVFPDYSALNSGYSLSADVSTLPAGNYTLCVAGIGNDGDVQWATRNITVGPAPLTDIDTYGPMTNGTLNVAGWALNKSGISRVDMYAWDSAGHPHSLGSVDGGALTARQDVQKAFPAYNMLNSGYWLTVPAGTLPAGNYTLAVAGIGNDGTVQWGSKTITIRGTTTAAPITDLDTPSTTYTGTIPVYGWALNTSGINRVDIYAYSSGSTTAIKLGSVDGGALTARQDVANAFPAYGILNSGYSYTVPAGTLAPGSYTLAVAGIGNDGDVKWETKGITVQKVANYQGINEVKTYTDEITGITQTVQFLGVGAGYCEVAGGTANINTTPALGAAHGGFNATVSLIGSNGIHQGGSTAVVGTSGTCSSLIFSNLTAATYTIQLAANDGTVVAKYSFTVDSNGNVE